MSLPDIPTSYSADVSVSGGLDLDLDGIRIKEFPKIELDTQSTVTSKSELTSSSTVDLGLNNIGITKLPPIDLRFLFSMRPTRVHLPVNVRLAICGLGKELLSFSICGEGMVVTEDYTPHKSEECS